MSAETMVDEGPAKDSPQDQKAEFNEDWALTLACAMFDIPDISLCYKDILANVKGGHGAAPEAWYVLCQCPACLGGFQKEVHQSIYEWAAHAQPAWDVLNEDATKAQVLQHVDALLPHHLQTPLMQARRQPRMPLSDVVRQLGEQAGGASLIGRDVHVLDWQKEPLKFKAYRVLSYSPDCGEHTLHHTVGGALDPTEVPITAYVALNFVTLDAQLPTYDAGFKAVRPALQQLRDAGDGGSGSGGGSGAPQGGEPCIPSSGSAAGRPGGPGAHLPSSSGSSGSGGAAAPGRGADPGGPPHVKAEDAWGGAGGTVGDGWRDAGDEQADAALLRDEDLRPLSSDEQAEKAEYLTYVKHLSELGLPPEQRLAILTAMLTLSPHRHPGLYAALRGAAAARDRHAMYHSLGALAQAAHIQVTFG